MHESSASACPCAAGPTLKPTIGSVIADDLSKYGDSNSLADENEDNEADVAPGSSGGVAIVASYIQEVRVRSMVVRR